MEKFGEARYNPDKFTGGLSGQKVLFQDQASPTIARGPEQVRPSLIGDPSFIFRNDHTVIVNLNYLFKKKSILSLEKFESCGSSQWLDTYISLVEYFMLF